MRHPVVIMVWCSECARYISAESRHGCDLDIPYRVTRDTNRRIKAIDIERQGSIQ